MKGNWIMLLVSMAFFSCEREADIPLPKTDPKLGLFSFLSPGKPVQVILVRVNPLFGPPVGNGPDYITNAIIRFSDGFDTSVLKLELGENYYVEGVPKIQVQEGKSYWIWAEAPGLPPVSASCTVPTQKVINMSWNHYGSIRQSDSVFHLSMIWKDIAGQENFYRINAENIDSTKNNLESRNVYGFSTRYYNDFGVDGEVLQSSIGFYEENPVNVKSRWIIASLITCEINYYRYHVSLEVNIDGNPLVGTASLYSNVNGGVGCFGAYLQHTDKIRLF